MGWRGGQCGGGGGGGGSSAHRQETVGGEGLAVVVGLVRYGACPLVLVAAMPEIYDTCRIVSNVNATSYPNSRGKLKEGSAVR